MNIDSIYTVIVLYNCSLKESSTVKTINDALKKIGLTLDILVYDNSASSQYPKINFTYKNLKCHYIHNANNPGIAEAYNTALDKFNNNDKQWLLLLDQDTHFSDDFFSEINTIKINNSDAIGAIIPNVVSLNGEQIISPMLIKTGGVVKTIKAIKPGLIRQDGITGINSGTLLSKSFLEDLKKFDTRFPLDMLDHWYFKELQKKNYNIYLLNTTINQELSIHNLEQQMSVDRYKKLIRSEKLFLESDFKNFIVFKLRLLFRLVKQMFYNDKSYFRITLKNIFNLNNGA